MLNENYKSKAVEPQIFCMGDFVEVSTALNHHCCHENRVKEDEAEIEISDQDRWGIHKGEDV